jgi:type IV pilus biogenesis protein CpaD/CtpE
MRTRTLPHRRAAVFLACLVLGATGCASKQKTTGDTGCASKQKTTGDISSVKQLQGIGPGGLTADEIQSQVMGFSDTYSAYIRQAVAQVMTGDVTPQQRANAHRSLLTTRSMGRSPSRPAPTPSSP